MWWKRGRAVWWPCMICILVVFSKCVCVCVFCFQLFFWGIRCISPVCHDRTHYRTSPDAITSGLKFYMFPRWGLTLVLAQLPTMVLCRAAPRVTFCRKKTEALRFEHESVVLSVIFYLSSNFFSRIAVPYGTVVVHHRILRIAAPPSIIIDRKSSKL